MAETFQFCVGLANKPGTLAALCRSLREASVNVDALFISGDDDGTWVNLIASPLSLTRRALTDGGYNFYTEKVLTLRAQNKPGELERVASSLSEAGININYVYGSTLGQAPFTLVLHVSDLASAAKLFDD